MEEAQGGNSRVEEVAGNCDENRSVREKDSFQVDLRVHGVSQDAIYKDEERMTRIQTLVDKLQDGYGTNSIISDLEEKGFSNTFSEASRRTFKEMGNIESYEGGETFRTIQCQSCLKFSTEGTVDCLCDICLMPSLEHRKDQESNRYHLKSTIHIFVKRGQPEKRYGPQQWQCDHWQAQDATMAARKKQQQVCGTVISRAD